MREHLPLSPLRKLYEKTKDPLYVWEAIKFIGEFYKNNDVPLPDWIREYLLLTSKEILSLDCEGKQYYQNLANAVGIKSKSITEKKRKFRNIEIYLFIKNIKNEHNSIDQCYAVAAKEFNLEKTGVGKIYREIALIVANAQE